jgi:hypothetical protein
MINMNQLTKICTKCGDEKKYSDFHWRDSTRTSKRTECKQCKYEQEKQNREYKLTRVGLKPTDVVVFPKKRT